MTTLTIFTKKSETRLHGANLDTKFIYQRHYLNIIKFLSDRNSP